MVTWKGGLWRVGCVFLVLRAASQTAHKLFSSRGLETSAVACWFIDGGKRVRQARKLDVGCTGTALV